MLEVTIVQGIFYHQDLFDRHLQKVKVKRTSKWVAGNEWGLELPDKIPKSFSPSYISLRVDVPITFTFRRAES